MRRGRKHTVEQYIDVRISQLASDMSKAKDDYDKQWYNRLIQELSWVRSRDHDCHIEHAKSAIKALGVDPSSL